MHIHTRRLQHTPHSNALLLHQQQREQQREQQQREQQLGASPGMSTSLSGSGAAAAVGLGLSPPLSGQHAPLHGPQPLGSSPWARGAGPLQITAPRTITTSGNYYGSTPQALMRTRSGGSSSSSLAGSGSLGGGQHRGQQLLLSSSRRSVQGGLVPSASTMSLLEEEAAGVGDGVDGEGALSSRSQRPYSGIIRIPTGGGGLGEVSRPHGYHFSLLMRDQSVGLLVCRAKQSGFTRRPHSFSD